MRLAPSLPALFSARVHVNTTSLAFQLRRSLHTRTSSYLHSYRPFLARHHSRVARPGGFKMPHSQVSLLKKSKVLVFGAGNFGSCLADHLADSLHDVFVWSRTKEIVDTLNATHRNPEFLKDHFFPENLKAVGPEFPSPKLVQEMDVLLFAIPTEGVRLA